ncbi:MAG: acyl-CoA dehydrogenase, partial [Planctomycetota bacterium]
MTLLVLALLAALAFALLLADRPGLAAFVPLVLGLGIWQVFGSPGYAPWIVAVLLVAVVALPEVRRGLISGPVLKAIGPDLPTISETEQVALEAGTVWWDKDLFSGNPDWNKLLDFRGPGLTEREQSFLENEVEELCRMVDCEEVDKLGDLTPEAWAFLGKAGFMGLIIPEEYGGLAFSSEAVSAIITKASTHNVTLAVTIMLPSSLGPAELLLHYGTQAQRDHFLPLLARGEEIPAFALTEPFAGSDAGAMRARGVVCEREIDGKTVLGLNLNWDKRYITLAPNCTLLGLAFKAEDPDGLLGQPKDYGITCALVAADLPGVETGLRHDPLGVKFINGPTTGKDVFIPMERVIGEQGGLGQGWRMLMDCLSAGRALSLPGLAAGALQTCTATVTAYGSLREQFGMPIGKLEGVADPIGRIAGTSWMITAARELTASAVASGEKPSVISAIMKAWCTEAMRDGVNDAMDVQAGAGICRGSRNVLARYYQAIPIGITVEGANILTRTLIVFGQGVLR